MSKWARGALDALLALACCLLAGCADVVDPDEARICRLLIAGLEGGADRVAILASRALTPARLGDNGGLEIAYEVQAHGHGRRHVIACKFDRGRASAALPRHMTGAAIDGRALGPARLYLSRRFWLGTPAAAAADPEPIAGLGRAGTVPPSLAILMQALIAALPQTGTYLLLALACSLVQALAARPNLAFGDVAALGGYGAALGVVAAGGASAPLTALAAGLLLGAFTSAINAGIAGRAVFEPLRRASGQSALIASAAVALVIAETARLAQGAAARPVPPLLDVPHAIARAGDYVVTATPAQLAAGAFSLSLAILVLAGMHRSRFGRAWRASADDPLAASLMGIDPRRLAINTYGLAGVLAGCAGAVATLTTGAATHGTGLVLGLKAVIAAILGGVGSLGGAALVAVLIGLLEALWSVVLPIEHREAGLFVIVVAALVLRPGGLAGRPDLESPH